MTTDPIATHITLPTLTITVSRPKKTLGLELGPRDAEADTLEARQVVDRVIDDRVLTTEPVATHITLPTITITVTRPQKTPGLGLRPREELEARQVQDDSDDRLKQTDKPVTTITLDPITITGRVEDLRPTKTITLPTVTIRPTKVIPDDPVRPTIFPTFNPTLTIRPTVTVWPTIRPTLTFQPTVTVTVTVRPTKTLWPTVNPTVTFKPTIIRPTITGKPTIIGPVPTFVTLTYRPDPVEVAKD